MLDDQPETEISLRCTSVVTLLRGLQSPAASLVGEADVLLDEPAAAEFLRIGPRTLQRHRQHGTGPAFVRVGKRRLVYRFEDLRNWVQQQREVGHARAA